MGFLGAVARRWLFGGAGAVLIAVAVVTVVLVRSGSAACAAPPATEHAPSGHAPAAAPAAHAAAPGGQAPAVGHAAAPGGHAPAGLVPAAAGLAPGFAKVSGKATFYAATGAGNCSFDRVSQPLVVALGPSDYRAGAACGGYLDVTGPKGSVRVKVVDKCPECPAGHIDLSREAFTKIANPVDGIVPITFRTVADPALPGPVTVRVKEGSSQYWLALRFDNHGNALSSAELKVGSGWQKLQRTDFNYWIDETGAGSGPFTVRLTDSTSRRTVVPGIKLSPEAVQRTGVEMYSGAAGQAANPTGTTSTAPSAPARASASASVAASASTDASATAQAADAQPPAPVRAADTCS